MQRAWNAQQQAAPPPPPPLPAAGSKRRIDQASSRATPGRQPSTVQGSATASTPKQPAQPTSQASQRTGPVLTQKKRRSVKEIEEALATKAAAWLQYKTAHKTATMEYASFVSRGTQRRKGCTPGDVASRYDSTLSPNNPHRITPLYSCPVTQKCNCT